MTIPIRINPGITITKMWLHLPTLPSLSAIIFAIFLVLLDSAAADISCYECDSSHNFTCNEFWDPDQAVNQRYRTNCRHVFEVSTEHSGLEAGAPQEWAECFMAITCKAHTNRT